MRTVTVDGVTFGEGSPKIIIPIVGKTELEILDIANDIKDLDFDLAEWRIDFYDKVEEIGEVSKLSYKVKEVIKKPLLVTFRSSKEGGVLEITDEKYFDIYKDVVENSCADLLDVELFMPEKEVEEIVSAAHNKGIKIVMCNHDFDDTPEKDEIVKRLTSMSQKNADICKIAVMPNNEDDVLTLLAATLESKKSIDRPLITMSMGALGMVSRVSGEVFGSTATFGAAKKASAPGQVPVDELRLILNSLKLQ